ncbi:AzlD domain-containing protein [Alicyclobacillus dauci]|uniref:AzlD domain-containing protein n=1 Tax=Alicyclobacillus dauci TaxID=1475485 RepID=A0ABY6Z4I5_9BACL|nr:AzlD domain-containing protein [Alicyclobacillus dauci]WAH37797.1 AzlD domain-containing protein [Alicyclobacillus dauci]
MNQLLLEIVIVGVGTYLIRAGSLSLGSRITWPLWAQKWLTFVTPAVLGALIGPELFTANGHFIPLSHNPLLLAAVPTAIVAWFSRNLLLTVAVGVVAFAVLTRVM